MGIAALAALLALAAMPRGITPVESVDPFIGTGGHGHTHPAATLPFGMVQVGPDTRLAGWDGSSGYHDDDRVIYGFSHTHLSGTGIPDYGDILITPVTGIGKLEDAPEWEPGPCCASRFSKRTERAGPGWYTVELSSQGVGVELTATERTGWHRYRFPAGRPAHVVVDLRHRDRLLDASLRVVSDREIEGFRRSTGWARDQIVHFVARFSIPFEVGAMEPSRGLLSFGRRGATLVIKVGISAVDIDGARRNLEAEARGWDFDAARREAMRRWSDALGRVELEGGSPASRIIFYTALYHSLLAPNIYSDVDGRYLGMDRRVHRIEPARARRHYTVFSLWDTFRATHPLFTILEPERTREFIGTFLAMSREGGRLPVWELAANETDTMIGYHAVSVIADAWIKGIRGFDAEAALQAMVHDATLDRAGLDAYRRQGFIGSEDASESVSRTLEYGYDDACIARMADSMARGDVAAEFHRRSQAWRHLLDPETGFMRPRRAQRWLDPFDPRRVDNNFTEADAWQYSTFVPHDLEGLIEALGGDAAFVSRLDALFDADSRTIGREQADITGRIGQYAHGNEPSHNVAWLYHYAGRPDRSAERVSRIRETMYAAAPDGLSGNEDCGQMSSWYVLAALGLYPVMPCSDEYVLVPPLFARATLHLEAGRTSRYVTGATLDGARLTRSYLRHAQIAGGGELVLSLGPGPDRSWGAAPADRPRSRAAGQRVLPAPFVRGPERFLDSATVEMGCAEPGATIRYSLDPAGARQEPDWSTYSAPLTLRESARIRLFAEKGGRRSPVVAAPVYRLPNDWEVEVSTSPNAQYTAGGPEALIDGLRGEADWRTGGWQGYQGTDFEATVDLRERRAVRRAGGSFLQDAASWIWMPVEVIVSVSEDGKTFREVARTSNDLPDREEGILMREMVVPLVGVTARYVRIHARSYGRIPDWHPGRGGQAFIFVDEIVVR